MESLSRANLRAHKARTAKQAFLGMQRWIWNLEERKFVFSLQWDDHWYILPHGKVVQPTDVKLVSRLMSLVFKCIYHSESERRGIVDGEKILSISFLDECRRDFFEILQEAKFMEQGRILDLARAYMLLANTTDWSFNICQYLEIAWIVYGGRNRNKEIWLFTSKQMLYTVCVFTSLPLSLFLSASAPIP